MYGYTAIKTPTHVKYCTEFLLDDLNLRNDYMDIMSKANIYDK